MFLERQGTQTMIPSIVNHFHFIPYMPEGRLQIITYFRICYATVYEITVGNFFQPLVFIYWHNTTICNLENVSFVLVVGTRVFKLVVVQNGSP